MGRLPHIIWAGPKKEAEGNVTHTREGGMKMNQGEAKVLALRARVM